MIRCQLIYMQFRWTGNTMTLASCNETILESNIGSIFVGGSTQVIGTLCLENEFDGLLVEVGGGTYKSEVSWSITLPSGEVETGAAGTTEIGLCPRPSPQPSITLTPTAQPSITSMPTACELYTFSFFDRYGDGLVIQIFHFPFDCLFVCGPPTFIHYVRALVTQVVGQHNECFVL